MGEVSMAFPHGSVGEKAKFAFEKHSPAQILAVVTKMISDEWNKLGYARIAIYHLKLSASDFRFLSKIDIGPVDIRVSLIEFLERNNLAISVGGKLKVKRCRSITDGSFMVTCEKELGRWPFKPQQKNAKDSG